VTLSELIHALKSVQKQYYLHDDPVVVSSCFASHGSSWEHINGVCPGMMASGEMVLKTFIIDDRC